MHSMFRRSLSLGVWLLVLQVVIVLMTTCAAGLFAAKLQSDRIREAYKDRMLSVALSVARLPTVVQAFDSPDPAATIQPLAELIRHASQVTYVVVTDHNGVRYAHPDPKRIGERVSTDPSTPLSGEVFVGTETGTLGTSLRAKVPVRAEDGRIIGMASVGILESQLSDDLAEDLPELIGWLAAAALVGVLGAALVTQLVRRRTFRLEPAEIAQLLETRDAMLHGIRAVTTAGATLHWVPAAFLAEHNVSPWGDMPVWVPDDAENAGFGRTVVAKAVAAGLTFRPLATTAADTLAWFNALPAERREKLRAGITPEREKEVLAAWKARA